MRFIGSEVDCSPCDEFNCYTITLRFQGGRGWALNAREQLADRGLNSAYRILAKELTTVIPDLAIGEDFGMDEFSSCTEIKGMPGRSPATTRFNPTEHEVVFSLLDRFLPELPNRTEDALHAALTAHKDRHAAIESAVERAAARIQKLYEASGPSS